MKFKVGDRVRCVDNDDGSLRNGRFYTISRVHEHVPGAFVGTRFVQVRERPGCDYFAWRFVRVNTVAPKNRSRVDAGPRTL